MNKMANAEPDIKAILENSLPDTGLIIQGEGLYMEALDPVSRETWMSVSSVSQGDFDNWKPDPPYQKTFIGGPAMDAAGFRHAPEDVAQPVQVKMIAGHLCLKVAIPEKIRPPEAPEQAIQIRVKKAHTLGFKASRSVKLMTRGDQHFVEVIGHPDSDSLICFPPDAVCREVTLDQPWLVELPSPTQAYFWFHKTGIRGFQGPVSLPDLRADK